MKIHRNEPCPCGSGKKYKKCCLSSVQEVAPKFVSVSGESFDHIPDVDEHDHDGHDCQQHLQPISSQERRSRPELGKMSPYSVVRMVEDKLPKNDPKVRRLWLPEDVERLSTEEILARFQRIGIRLDKENFLGMARGKTWAWRLSDAWRTSGMRSEDDDFIGLATCELWKRWIPETPSVEMLDDWMQEGYRLLSERKTEAACDIWQKTWDVIRSRMTPDMTTCDEATEVFDGVQCLFNWTQDFTLELANASLKAPVYAERGIKYIHELLDQFKDEDENYRTNALADVGDLLFKLGNKTEGTRVFLDLIRDHPHLGIGYCRLSDHVRATDREWANKLLDEAQAKASDKKYWDVQARKEDLQDPKEAGSRSQAGT